jgi:type IV pilus assembly protein PilN
MIRINLLPFRIARKKENIRRQISIFFLLILLSAVALFWYTQAINKQISGVKEKTVQVNNQIEKYKEKADRVTKIKKDLAILEEKLKTVASLNKQRKEHFDLFDGMTGLIIPERMWLESFSSDDKTVTIKGIAYDNPTIAEFMEKLEKSPLFSAVDLKTAKMKSFKNDVMLKSFELLCLKEIPKDEEKEDAKQGKK